jgi:hypothetical protein
MKEGFVSYPLQCVRRLKLPARMGRLSLSRERGRVRVCPGQVVRTAEPLTLILSPSLSGEAKIVALTVMQIQPVAKWLG